MSWITRLKTWATEQPVAKAEQPQEEVIDLCVQAPVIGFVKTVKASPKWFRARKISAHQYDGVRYRWETDYKQAYYSITDRQEKIEFHVMYSSGRIYNVHGVDFALNGWETEYLHKHLSPIFLRASKRLDRIRESGERRARAVKAAIEQARRDKWTAMYGE